MRHLTNLNKFLRLGRSSATRTSVSSMTQPRNQDQDLVALNKGTLNQHSKGTVISHNRSKNRGQTTSMVTLIVRRTFTHFTAILTKRQTTRSKNGPKISSLSTPTPSPITTAPTLHIRAVIIRITNNSNIKVNKLTKNSISRSKNRTLIPKSPSRIRTRRVVSSNGGMTLNQKNRRNNSIVISRITQISLNSKNLTGINLNKIGIKFNQTRREDTNVP